MNTRLTLTMDQKIISATKTYAKKHQVTLSKIVENYFSYLLRKTEPDIKLSAPVEDLSGIIELPAEYNDR